MNWILLTPELTLLAAAALFLVLACLKPDPRRDYQLAYMTTGEKGEI